MRSNTRQVLEAFLKGKACNRCEAIHTDGKRVYSYAVVIAVKNLNTRDGYLVTSQKYSHTTTCQCHGIATGLTMAGKTVHYASQCEIDCDGKELTVELSA